MGQDLNLLYGILTHTRLAASLSCIRVFPPRRPCSMCESLAYGLHQVVYVDPFGPPDGAESIFLPIHSDPDGLG